MDTNEVQRGQQTSLSISVSALSVSLALDPIVWLLDSPTVVAAISCSLSLSLSLSVSQGARQDKTRQDKTRRPPAMSHEDEITPGLVVLSAVDDLCVFPLSLSLFPFCQRARCRLLHQQATILLLLSFPRRATKKQRPKMLDRARIWRRNAQRMRKPFSHDSTWKVTIPTWCGWSVVALLWIDWCVFGFLTLRLIGPSSDSEEEQQHTQTQIVPRETLVCVCACHNGIH